MTKREVITPPVNEPVTLTEFKAHARIDGTNDDVYLTDILKVAREVFERDTGLYIMPQVWGFWFDRIPVQNSTEWWDGVREGSMTQEISRFLEIQSGPIQSIDQVSYYRTGSSVAQIFSDTLYHSDLFNCDGKVILNEGSSWPGSLRLTNAIKIEATLGYPAGQVPEDIKHIIKIGTLGLYENRGDCSCDAGKSTISSMMESLVKKIRRIRI